MEKEHAIKESAEGRPQEGRAEALLKTPEGGEAKAAKTAVTACLTPQGSHRRWVFPSVDKAEPYEHAIPSSQA